MIDPKSIELMNRVLDGAATEPERADLDRTLAASPEARAHYEAMGRLVRRLDSVPMADPPAHLHPRVVSAIDSVGVRPSVWQKEEPGFFGWLHRAIGRQGLRYASTFGLGLAAGAVILAVVRPQPVDPSQVSGTLAALSASGSMPVAVPEAGVAGSVAVLDRGPVTQVRLKVDAEGTEWVFDVPDRAEPTHSVVLRVVKSGETVFEGTVEPVKP